MLFCRKSKICSQCCKVKHLQIFPSHRNTEIRPGLVKSKANQRLIAVSSKKAKYDEDHRAKMKPTKLLEEERRNEGLSIAITPQNKGFAMLAKMGYKEGEAIGRTSNGILEPIGIDIKKDRGGLGRDAALKQLKEHRQMIRLSRLKTGDSNNEISTDEFRKRMTQKAQGKTLVALFDLKFYLQEIHLFTGKQMEADLG